MNSEEISHFGAYDNFIISLIKILINISTMISASEIT